MEPTHYCGWITTLRLIAFSKNVHLEEKYSYKLYHIISKYVPAKDGETRNESYDVLTYRMKLDTKKKRLEELSVLISDCQNDIDKSNEVIAEIKSMMPDLLCQNQEEETEAEFFELDPIIEKNSAEIDARIAKQTMWQEKFASMTEEETKPYRQKMGKLTYCVESKNLAKFKTLIDTTPEIVFFPINKTGRNIFNYVMEKRPFDVDPTPYYEHLMKYDCSIYTTSNHYNYLLTPFEEVMDYHTNRFGGKCYNVFLKFVEYGALRQKFFHASNYKKITKYILKYKNSIYADHLEKIENYYKELLEIKNFNDTMIEFHPDGEKAKEILEKVKSMI